MHLQNNRWLQFVVLTGLALGTWTLFTLHGYAWQMLWLPAAIAGATWPRPTPRRGHCLRRLRRGAGRPLDNP